MEKSTSLCAGSETHEEVCARASGAASARMLETIAKRFIFSMFLSKIVNGRGNGAVRGVLRPASAVRESREERRSLFIAWRLDGEVAVFVATNISELYDSRRRQRPGLAVLWRVKISADPGTT